MFPSSSFSVLSAIFWKCVLMEVIEIAHWLLYEFSWCIWVWSMRLCEIVMRNGLAYAVDEAVGPVICQEMGRRY